MYTNYNHRLREECGGRVQKISIHAGFTCPNRDGSKGEGGCTFCNNQTFHPEYCTPTKSSRQQMEEGIAFFSKYKGQKYLAYFQAYTNTYASLDELKQIYEPVFDVPDVIGIVVGTRPDCVSDELLDYFAEMSKRHYVMIEYGVESTNDATLLRINRGHTYKDSVVAIEKTHDRGLYVGAHLILGLPGESRDEILGHADAISKLPLDMLKLHQLQIVKGTVMADEYRNSPSDFCLYTAEEYIDLCVRFLERLDPRIGLERFVSQSPQGMLIAPEWGLKNYEFISKLEKEIKKRGTFQGKCYKGLTITD